MTIIVAFLTKGEAGTLTIIVPFITKVGKGEHLKQITVVSIAKAREAGI